MQELVQAVRKAAKNPEIQLVRKTFGRPKGFLKKNKCCALSGVMCNSNVVMPLSTTGLFSKLGVADWIMSQFNLSFDEISEFVNGWDHDDHTSLVSHELKSNVEFMAGYELGRELIGGDDA